MFTPSQSIVKFGDLRQSNDWWPEFYQDISVRGTAYRINRPHEDFPSRIPQTEKAIELRLSNSIQPTVEELLTIHEEVFYDTLHAGMFRRVSVSVGSHVPPRWDLISRLMENLCSAYLPISTIDDLLSWYYDFETIHPFQDGNGRVGGIVVAVMSWKFLQNEGFLAPA